MPDPFVHYHMYTEFSLLDGASRIEPLMRAASGMGMPAIGVTDHGTMYGAVEFYLQARQHGLTPIAGAEAVAVNGQRVTATTGFGQVVAVGDPATLEGALNIRGGLVDGVRALGLSIAVKRQADLTVPAYRGVLECEHARLVE
jgi:DNA polymerase-3 subunit alpha